MKWTGAYIVASYVGLAVFGGWYGLLGAALHLGVMLLVTRRR